MSLALNLRVDGPVIAFSLGLILIAILATGLAPALYASSPALAQVLSGELVVGGTGKAVRRNILVIAQVAVCTLVLVGMGLCERSLSNLRHVDPGFSERKLVALAVYPENATSTGTKPMYAEMKGKVAALGGVESVALASSLPLLGGSVETVLMPGGVKKARVAQSSVDEDFFSTFGIRVLSGRVFNSIDQEKSPAVVVINHKMGEMFWPGKDPLGQTVMIGDQPKKFMVVGVVADGRYDDLDEDQKPYFYFPLSQRNESGINVVARTKGDPELWVVPMAQALRMPGAVPLNPMTYENWLNLTLIAQRLTSACVAGLGALGLTLAAIGLFGAISYSVSERRREIGIRVALGARPGQLLRMILRHTLLVAGSGVMLGVLLGVGATIALRSQFYGIGAVEWTVLVPVGAAMLALSALVAYLSARPWVGMNPMEAVRHT
jgi:predicted permease